MAYKVVSIALDLTGRRLTDEICHVAAFCHPDKTFSQYVMPFNDVSLVGVKAHGVRVFTTTFGRYRVLKDLNTGRILKTKSEYSTLLEFVQWLQEVKGDAKGLIIAFHDNKRDTVTPFLIEALNRYKIADEFFDLVKSFVNVEQLAEDFSEEPESQLKGKNLSLRPLCKTLLTKDELNPLKDAKDKERKNKSISFRAFQSAKTRAHATYMVLQKLLNCEEIGESERIGKRSVDRATAVEALAKLKEDHLAADKTRREQQQSKNGNNGKAAQIKVADKTPQATEVPTSELMNCKTEISASERVIQVCAGGESVC